jgi:hypothetical protein
LGDELLDDGGSANEHESPDAQIRRTGFGLSNSSGQKY